MRPGSVGRICSRRRRCARGRSGACMRWRSRCAVAFRDRKRSAPVIGKVLRGRNARRLPSRSPGTPGRTEHRCGTAAGGWPPGSPCPGCASAGTGERPGQRSVPGHRSSLLPERDAIYRHAARQAAAATEHIRRCALTDPAAAADAAWAAADTLHVAARALRNRHLRCAADSYDRAARAPYGRLPRRSHDGDQLRQTARMIALAGNLTGDTTLIAIALVAQLVALAAAVAELRQAQQHAAQAAAARAAAAHLHSAVTQARSPGATLRPCPVASTHQGGQCRTGCPPRLPSRHEANSVSNKRTGSSTSAFAAAGAPTAPTSRTEPVTAACRELSQRRTLRWRAA